MWATPIYIVCMLSRFVSQHTTGVLNTLAQCALWTLRLFVTMNRCHVGCCPQLVFQPVVVCLCEGLVGGCVERPPRPTAGCHLWMLHTGAVAPPWLQLCLRQPGQVRNTSGVANKSNSIKIRQLRDTFTKEVRETCETCLQAPYKIKITDQRLFFTSEHSLISDNFFTVMSLRSRLLLLPVACEEESELPATNLAGSTTWFHFQMRTIFRWWLHWSCSHLSWSSFRSSILERCILKVSTSSVAVGTDDLDNKRSVHSEYWQTFTCYFKRVILPKLRTVKVFLYYFAQILRFPQFK